MLTTEEAKGDVATMCNLSEAIAEKNAELKQIDIELEYIMDIADASAASIDLRFTHDEVFDSVREKMNV